MPNIKFVLKEPSSKDDTLIYMFVNFNYNRLKVSTGEKIHKKYWNFKTQKVRESRGSSELAELNTRLDNLKAKMLKAYWSIQNDDIEPTPENVREKFDELMGIETKTKRTTLFEFIDNFIANRKATVKPNTIKKYETTKEHLENFCTHKGIKKLDFDDITLDFYYDFMYYMKTKLSFATNTCGKYISTLKVFLNEATELGLNKKNDFKSKRFTKPAEEVDKIYLNEKELTEIYNLDLSKNKTLEKVRDLFIMECYMGFRFSDMEKFGPKNIKKEGGKQIISLRTIKTHTKVSVPLHPKVNKILKKYKYKLPKTMTNQRTNLYLKDIGELAKINDLVETSKNKKGMVVTKDLEKYKLITTHTARRSFATNAYLADVPVLSIMKMTGHKTEKSFLGYIRMSSEENAIKLSTHEFFSEKNTEAKVVNLK